MYKARNSVIWLGAGVGGPKKVAENTHCIMHIPVNSYTCEHVRNGIENLWKPTVWKHLGHLMELGVEGEEDDHGTCH